MSSDIRTLLSRMADELDNYRQLLTDDRREVHALASEARAALAAAPESAVKQSLTTAPPAPLEGEVGELVEWLRRLCAASWIADVTHDKLLAIATLLEQLAAAAPAVMPDGPAVPNGREPASVTPEATGQVRPLSPAAQAVFDAWIYPARFPVDKAGKGAKTALAQALRAVADQAVPEAASAVGDAHDEARLDQWLRIRWKILAIAAELEGDND